MRRRHERGARPARRSVPVSSSGCRPAHRAWPSRAGVRGWPAGRRGCRQATADRLIVLIVRRGAAWPGGYDPWSPQCHPQRWFGGRELGWGARLGVRLSGGHCRPSGREWGGRPGRIAGMSRRHPGDERRGMGLFCDSPLGTLQMPALRGRGWGEGGARMPSSHTGPHHLPASVHRTRRRLHGRRVARGAISTPDHVRPPVARRGQHASLMRLHPHPVTAAPDELAADAR